MDYYLNSENTYQRLEREYQQYNALVVAFDFDNTVYDYHQKGLEFTQVIELLRQLKQIGCYLIIFTANDDYEFIKEYCTKSKIPYDSINQNPPFYQTQSPKIYYNALLDDRAGLRETYDCLSRLVKKFGK